MAEEGGAPAPNEGSQASAPAPAAGQTPPPTPTPPAGDNAKPVVTSNFPPAAPNADGRPDYVEERFWDANGKTIKADDLAKSYKEIRQLVSKRASELSGDETAKLIEERVNLMKDQLKQDVQLELSRDLPASADDYSYELDPTISEAMPQELRDWSQFRGDPMMTSMQRTLHELGIGNKGFQKVTASFLTSMAAIKHANADIEFQQLGGEGQARLDGLRSLATKYAPDHAEALMQDLSKAGSVAALEMIFRALGAPSIGGQGGAMPSNTAKYRSAEEIRKAQEDPRYWNAQRRDPAYVAEIEAAWGALYKN